MARAWWTVLAAVLVCYATWVVGSRLSTELLPEVHQGEFTFEVSLPVGTPLQETKAALEDVESAILAHQENIRGVLVTYGYDVTNIKRSDEGEHSARFKILVDRNRDVAGTEERVIERLRGYLAEVPDIETHLSRPVLFSARTPIEVEIQGDDLRQLKTYSQQAETILADLPQLADVEATLQSGAPEIQVQYERDRLMRYDLKIDQVARLVRDMVKGFEATLFNLHDRRIPILVRLQETDREYVEDIGNLTVNAGGEQPIPLHAIASLEIGEGPSEVRRVDGQRVALIRANLGAGSLGSAVQAIEDTLRREIAWPADMDFRITGQNEEWQRSKGSLYLALGLSVFLVYVIMAAQFESLLQPLIIMVTIPLAFFGSVLALSALNLSLSIVVFLGMIMLVGIVVNNAIVLLDYANQLQRRGLPLADAIASAGTVRLRPILMTTATTVLGLLPMAVGWGDGAEIRQPMAITVISGLLTSTILTLVIIPTLYFMVESWKARWVQTRPQTAPAQGAPPPSASTSTEESLV